MSFQDSAKTMSRLMTFVDAIVASPFSASKLKHILFTKPHELTENEITTVNTFVSKISTNLKSPSDRIATYNTLLSIAEDLEESKKEELRIMGTFLRRSLGHYYNYYHKVGDIYDY